jgi:DNA end-binding protein Ku
MAGHSFWTGYLKLSLVTCPVALTPATSESAKIRFHTLNRKTGNRVVSRYVDEETGRPVEEGDEAKGYARGENDYLILEDDELESVQLESTRTIDIERFAPADHVDWVWCDTPYYVTPDDPVGEEAYCVIRDAMRSTGMVGVSRLVLYRREREVVLTPRDNGIVLWTLRAGEEVRQPSAAFREAKEAALDTRLVDLVAKLIESRRATWSPKMARDPVQARLGEIIKEKKKGHAHKAPATAEGPEKPSNVVNIMDALRRSLAAEKGASKLSGRPKR